MAFGFIVMWASGHAMAELAEDDERLEDLLREVHCTGGVTLLALLVVCGAVRFANRPPPLPVGLSDLEQLASRGVHTVLYALPAMIMVIGWAGVNLGGHTMRWVGLDMPRVFPVLEAPFEETLIELTETLHMWFAYTMLALHAAAASASIGGPTDPTSSIACPSVGGGIDLGEWNSPVPVPVGGPVRMAAPGEPGAALEGG